MTTPNIAGLCERLRAALEGVTPGDLDTSDHIGSGNYNCPCCEGEGAVEGKTFTNFDGFAVGVQFFGVGDEFAKYEAFFRAANPQTVRVLLDTLERQAAEIERLRGALKPFAAAGQAIDANGFGVAIFPNDSRAFESSWSENGQDHQLTWGDFRRAALTGEDPGTARAG